MEHRTDIAPTVPGLHLPPAPRLATPPTRIPRARIWVAALAVLALFLAGNTVTWLVIRGPLDGVRSQILGLNRTIGSDRAAIERARNDLAVLRNEERALQADVDRMPDPAAVVAGSEGSIFAIYAGRWEGTAFVLSSGAGGSTLVTNFHVVADSWRGGIRQVWLRHGATTYDGRIQDVYPTPDIALIHVSDPLPPLAPAEGPAEVGEPVVVVGSPYGYEGTVSTGVVSALRGQYVQFSAATSPGSSGSPVLDRDGKVIGVAGAKIVGRGVEGLSFAIAIWRVCQLGMAC